MYQKWHPRVSVLSTIFTKVFIALTIVLAITVPVKAAEAPISREVEFIEIKSTKVAKLPKGSVSISKPKVSVPELMLAIARCESKNRQFNDDGTVLRGIVNPKDVGRFQINETYHLAAAKALGYDIYTWDGNTAYAMYLYKHQGTTPWNWSKPCWSKS